MLQLFCTLRLSIRSTQTRALYLVMASYRIDVRLKDDYTLRYGPPFLEGFWDGIFSIGKHIAYGARWLSETQLQPTPQHKYVSTDTFGTPGTNLVPGVVVQVFHVHVPRVEVLVQKQF